MKRGITPWVLSVDDRFVHGLRYRSDSGYSLCCTKINATRSCIVLLDGEQMLGQAALDQHHVAAVRALFDGNMQDRAEIAPFREQRPLGEVSGFQVQVDANEVTTLRIYKSRLFQSQILIALARSNRETCAVAFDDDELSSIVQILAAL
jgi:hypothetical protein